MFLEKYNKKEIFSKFLNLNKNFSYNLNIKFNIFELSKFMDPDVLDKKN